MSVCTGSTDCCTTKPTWMCVLRDLAEGTSEPGDQILAGCRSYSRLFRFSCWWEFRGRQFWGSVMTVILIEFLYNIEMIENVIEYKV